MLHGTIHLQGKVNVLWFFYIHAPHTHWEWGFQNWLVRPGPTRISEPEFSRICESSLLTMIFYQEGYSSNGQINHASANCKYIGCPIIAFRFIFNDWISGNMKSKKKDPPGINVRQIFSIQHINCFQSPDQLRSSWTQIQSESCWTKIEICHKKTINPERMTSGSKSKWMRIFTRPVVPATELTPLQFDVWNLPRM